MRNIFVPRFRFACSWAATLCAFSTLLLCLSTNSLYTQETQHTRSIRRELQFSATHSGDNDDDIRALDAVNMLQPQRFAIISMEVAMMPGMMPLPHTRCNNVCKRKRYWRIVEMELLSRIEWVSAIHAIVIDNIQYWCTNPCSRTRWAATGVIRVSLRSFFCKILKDPRNHERPSMRGNTALDIFNNMSSQSVRSKHCPPTYFAAYLLSQKIQTHNSAFPFSIKFMRTLSSVEKVQLYLFLIYYRFLDVQKNSPQAWLRPCTRSPFGRTRFWWANDIRTERLFHRT